LGFERLAIFLITLFHMKNVSFLNF